jgi:hypothetical protein
VPEGGSTARTALNQITRTFHYREKHMFLKLYKTYVIRIWSFQPQRGRPGHSVINDALKKFKLPQVVNMISGLTTVNYADRLKEQ